LSGKYNYSKLNKYRSATSTFAHSQYETAVVAPRQGDIGSTPPTSYLLSCDNTPNRILATTNTPARKPAIFHHH
jgi:hypothetical protein